MSPQGQSKVASAQGLGVRGLQLPGENKTRTEGGCSLRVLSLCAGTDARKVGKSRRDGARELLKRQQ